MQHKCKVTVLKKELFKDLQEKYLANPNPVFVHFIKKIKSFYLKGMAIRTTFGLKEMVHIVRKLGIV